MSFILDALKKSDDQRRLGQPPGINSPVQGAAPGGHRVALFAGAVLLALILASTLAWREWAGHGLLGSAGLVDRPDAPAEAPAADPEPAVAGADEDDEATEEALAEVEPIEPIESTEPDEAEPEQTASAPAVPRQRDPGAAPDEDAEQRRLAARQEAIERGRREAEREAREHEERREQQRLASIPEPDEVSPEEERPRPGTERPETVPDETGIEPDPDRDFVERWELPVNVRRDLPELRLTMHVYSEDPDSRFVLVNAERYREGDEVAPGVQLAEIRRDGAIMDYRQHRFLIAQ